MADVIERLKLTLQDRYVIERELGAGGMATVYLAHDVKHDRKVALKVLRPELAAVIGAERFLKEIKITANLQHPHVLGLIDSGERDGLLWYVMPFVEGESLRERLTRERQLPVADALRIATEVAGALDYAHRRGVVHRDIKPENILLHDGQALVADFGISLAVSSAGGTRMTETGMSLGTPHYMSPEQAMGEREISARSDVYALGCVTYEMLVGEPPFTGPTAQAILARVMTEEPRSLTIQRRTVPSHVESAIHMALAKLPADRFGSAAGFADALNNPQSGIAVASGTPARRARWRRDRIIIGTAALTLGVAVGALMRPSSRAPRDVVRVMMVLPDSGGVQWADNIRLAISPDGRRIAYVGPDASGSGLWVREMDRLESQLLPGTEGAEAPFFSPDGASIGFFVRRGSATDLRVTPATGGMVRTVIADSVQRYGGDWTEDGLIYFTDMKGGVARVSANGGGATVISRPDTARAAGISEHDYVAVLPGGRGALLQLWEGSVGQNEIGVLSFETGEIRPVTKGTYARFLAPNRLVYGTADGRLFVVPFNPTTMKLEGQPVLILQGVQTDGRNGTVQFAVSATGTLAYLGGQANDQQVVWVDRKTGRATPIDTSWYGTFTAVALSPDGSRLALAVAGPEEASTWVKRLPAGPLTRLTFRGSPSDRPEWTADGRAVAYLGTRNGRRTVQMRRADGSEDERPGVVGADQWDEVTFSGDGRWAIFRTRGTGPNTRVLYIAPAAADSAPRRLLETTYDNFAPQVSPDGHWLAYVSNESGQNEVYVRPFPDVHAARWTVSVGGGQEPLWAHSGHELFYRTDRGEVLTVPIATYPAFHAGTPHTLFTDARMASDNFHRVYDVTRDDQRFIMVRSAGVETTAIGVVFNWAAELDRRVGEGNARP